MSERLHRVSVAAASIAAVVALSGCSHSSPSDGKGTSAAASGAGSSSAPAVSGTPASAWPTSAPSTQMPQPTSNSSSSTPGHKPNSAQSSLPKTFMAAFLHTDGQSQDAWAKTMTSLTGPQFGGQLSIQGLERLPHHQHVTGSPQLLWVSNEEPEAQWFVPTSNGGYTLSEDLSDPKGKIVQMTQGKESSVQTDTD